jgi:hypothetical protein
MLALTFAGDESGDVSFSFGKGASRYFVVAVIATADPEALRQVVADVRQSSRLPPDYEFSFHELSSAPLRQRVFEALARATFESWAVVVDKAALADSFRFMRALDFYLYFVTELIRLIPSDKRPGATLILDEFGSASQLRTGLRRAMVARNIPRQFRRVLVKRSKGEPLIQVADLVAGSLLQHKATGDTSTYDYVGQKVKQVLEFPG